MKQAAQPGLSHGWSYRPRWRIGAILGLAVFGGILPGLRATTWEFEIKPRGGDNFLAARFRGYLPDMPGPVRGVAVLVPGYNEDGRSWVDEGEWRQFAGKYQLALLGCEFQGDATHDYSNARRGSGRALLDVMRDWSDLSEKRELNNANFMIWGVTSGAQFAASMALEKPDRMLGFAALLGSYWLPATGSSRKVPGVFISAGDQADGAAGRTRLYFSTNRSLGASWSYMETASTSLAMDKLRPWTLSFLGDAMLIRQKPEDRPASNLQNVSQLDGWVVETGGVTLEPVPAVDVRRSALARSHWFPSQTTAQKWISLRSQYGVPGSP